MRHLAAAVILACVLSGTASAGEIPTGDRTHPTGSSSQITPGEIPSGDRTGEIPTSDDTASSALVTIILTLLTIGR